MEIRTRHVLRAVLAETLSSHAQGMSIHLAYQAVDAAYQFPEDWYRHIPCDYKELEDLGIKDWREVRQEELKQLVKTEPQWQNELRWARNDLRKMGFLDSSAPRGIWRLTTAGQVFASAKADLTPPELMIATPRPRQQAQVKNTDDLDQSTVKEGFEENQQTNIPITIGPTHRSVLLDTLRIMSAGMNDRDLEILVDIARAIRMRDLIDRQNVG